MTEGIVSPDLEEELRSGPEYSPRLEQLMENARSASDFLKALSHENRLLLLCLLAERERSVSVAAPANGFAAAGALAL